MRPIGRRDIVAAILIALVTGSAFTYPPLQNLQGLSLDILTALRWKLIGDRRDPTTSPVVVVAIDGETYETPPFKGSPTQTWTREIGRVLGSITEVEQPAPVRLPLGLHHLDGLRHPGIRVAPARRK